METWRVLWSASLWRFNLCQCRLCSVLMGLQAAAEYGLPVGIDGIAGNMLATSPGCFLSHILVPL